MKYTGKKFSVAVGSSAYRENFDRIFRSEKKACCPSMHREPNYPAPECLKSGCKCICHSK